MNKLLVAKIGFFILLVIFSRCNIKKSNSIIKDYSNIAFAGSSTCMACHSEIYNSHLKTAHFKTTQLASEDKILGSMTQPGNTVHLNRKISFEMTMIDDTPYQSAFVNGKLLHKVPIDIIIGSGTKGQSYLYWKDQQLYQMPVSYKVADRDWSNSPGYSNDIVDFSREVLPYCLNCHMTFARNDNPIEIWSNSYVKDQMIYGVDCESCHGPSQEHVTFHFKNPEATEAFQMTDITSLSRQQRLDACAMCHSGLREPIKPAFLFRAGDNIDDFSTANYIPSEVATLDVHGNQYGLLTSSKCFQQSPDMDCSTCHDPHSNERGKQNKFSELCINCHKDLTNHSQLITMDEMKSNCIDCHMPLRSSANLTFQKLKQSESDSLLVRTHRISVYQNASQDVINYLKTLSVK